MAEFIHSSSMPLAAFAIIGEAIRSAQDLGAHRRTTGAPPCVWDSGSSVSYSVSRIEMGLPKDEAWVGDFYEGEAIYQESMRYVWKECVCKRLNCVRKEKTAHFSSILHAHHTCLRSCFCSSLKISFPNLCHLSAVRCSPRSCAYRKLMFRT